MKKKIIIFSILLCLSFILEITNVNALEKNKPFIDSVDLSETNVYHGELISISLDVTDESEIKYVVYYFQREGKGFAIYSANALIQDDGSYRGTFEITDDFDKTFFTLGVIVCDIYDNCIEQQNILQLNILDGEKLDKIGPVVESISIDKTTVKKDDIVKVTMVITDESEIQNVMVSCYKNGYGSGIATTSAEKQDDGTYIANIKITEDFANGYTYYVNPFAYDIHGNSLSSYSTPVFTVDDETLEKDVIGPVVESIILDKEYVKIGEKIKITMVVTDESEISNVSVATYKNGYGSGIEVITAEEQGDGTYVAYIAVDDKYEYSWYLIIPSAEDIYGNSVRRYNDAKFTISNSRNGLYNDNGVLKYYIEGICDNNQSLIYDDGVDKWYVINSVADESLNGVYSLNENYYKIINGKIDESFTGKLKINNKQGYFKNGVCTKLEELDSELLNANTVSFKDNLSLNFLAEISDDELDGAYVIFKYNHYGEDKEVKVPINLNDKNGKYYRFRCELTASEMMIPVTAELYLKDFTEPVSMFTRSIREYIVSGLEKSTNAKEKALFRATLNYGGYTQIEYIRHSLKLL